jgi:hypothetical protein
MVEPRVSARGWPQKRRRERSAIRPFPKRPRHVHSRVEMGRRHHHHHFQHPRRMAKVAAAAGRIGIGRSERQLGHAGRRLAVGCMQTCSIVFTCTRPEPTQDGVLSDTESPIVADLYNSLWPALGRLYEPAAWPGSQFTQVPSGTQTMRLKRMTSLRLSF